MRLLCASLLSLLALPAAAQQPSIHQLESEAHHGEIAPFVPPTLWALPPPPAHPRILTRQVFGYLPYWVTTSVDNVRWDLLSTFAWFAIAMDSAGAIVDWNGWGGTRAHALRDAARANGVNFELTVTLFSSTAIATLLASASARSLAVQNLADAVTSEGADGVDIDFEFVPLSAKANFVTFIQELKGALGSRSVSIAMPSIDYSGAYDYDQLALACDGLMIMAYGYHWGGGNPGPLSPLTTGGFWGGRDLVWTVDDYLRYGGLENRGDYILGLPFYGHDWPSTSDLPGASQRSNGSSVFYKNAISRAAQYGRRWDDYSKTPWYAYDAASDGWHQVWYDDKESFLLKLQLINEKDIGGLGIWALGYEGSKTAAIWEAIEDRLTVVFNTAPVAWAGADQAVTTGDPVTLAAEGTDADGDALTFRWTQTEGAAVTLAGADTPSATFTAAAAGRYSFAVFVEDGFTESAPDVTSVTVTDLPPPDAGPIDAGPEIVATEHPNPSRPAWTEPADDEVGAGGDASRGCGCGGESAGFAWLIPLAALTLARKRR